jgi:release factor glutamine methyltransferase
MIVKPISWRDAIDAAEQELRHAATNDARLTAELLAAHVMGVWTRGEVREQANQLLSQEDLDLYRSFIRRRIQHEPLQYITGETEFFGLRLFCSPAALIPRADTEILVEEALKEVSVLAAGIRILDIGTGSGCIALAIASKLPDAAIVGIDDSTNALELAERNRKRCLLENVEFKQANIHQDNEMLALGKFDLIVSNPPYIPVAEYRLLDTEVHDFEPHDALTDDGNGLSFYTAICRLAPYLLDPKGKLLFEIGFGAKDAIVATAHKLQLCRVTQDLAGIDRVIMFGLGGNSEE